MLIGLLPGEGLGPELIGHCQTALAALGSRFGQQPEQRLGPALEQGWNRDIECFLREILTEGGAVLSGPGGGRYVYDLRRHLRLDYKLNPLRPLHGIGQQDFDVLVVRHTGGGPFQAREERQADKLKVEYTIELDELRRVAQVADHHAQQRKGQLAVALKPHGQPGLARLWSEACQGLQSHWTLKECDWVAYHLLKYPQDFDVIVTPDDIGDILSDLGGLLVGSRGLTYGASFNREGRGVFQTNHGAAYDLVGQNRANPVGQLLSLAYLLEELGHPHWARHLVGAIEQVLKHWRTFDLVAPAAPFVGTSEWMQRLQQALLA